MPQVLEFDLSQVVNEKAQASVFEALYLYSTHDCNDQSNLKWIRSYV